jgi:hypothetical protein
VFDDAGNDDMLSLVAFARRVGEWWFHFLTVLNSRGWGAIEAGRLCRERGDQRGGEGKGKGKLECQAEKFASFIKRMLENVWPASKPVCCSFAVRVWRLNEIGTLHCVCTGRETVAAFALCALC